jgi:hypothetical protein
MRFYDDNFGDWNGCDEVEVRRFYRQTQRTNVRKRCEGCGVVVRIQPHYAYCNGCATIMERGGELPEYYHSHKVATVTSAPLPLTPAEAAQVTAWKAERAVHAAAAKADRDAAKRWNLSLKVAPVAKKVTRRPKAG